MSRELTDLENLFLKEARQGFFETGIDEEDGSPFAMGAALASNIFSMPVIEYDDPFGTGGSIYTLKNEYEE